MPSYTYHAVAIITGDWHVKIGSYLQSHMILSERTFCTVFFEIPLPATEVDLVMEKIMHKKNSTAIKQYFTMFSPLVRIYLEFQNYLEFLYVGQSMGG